MKLKHHISWITGAAGGLGKAISKKFAQEGSHLILSDNNEEALRDTVEQITSNDVEVLTLPMDVSDPNAVKDGAEKIKDQFGRVDNLINNAGISPKGPDGAIPFRDITLADWNQVLSVNLTGPFLCSQAALEMMVKQERGCIVNVCSQAARTYSPVTSPHYAASKSGLLGLSRKISGEFGPYGIRTNVIVPGRIDTPMTQSVDENLSKQAAQRTPLRRIGEPKEVADSILYLVSDEASYVNGAVLDVNGGSLMI